MLISSVLNILDQHVTQVEKVPVREKEPSKSPEDRYYRSVAAALESRRNTINPESDSSRPGLTKVNAACIVSIQRGYEEFCRTLEMAMLPPPPPGLDITE